MGPSVASKVLGTAGQAFIPATIIYGWYSGYQEKTSKGWNPLAAGLVETGAQALPFMMNPFLYLGLTMGLPLTRAAGAAVTSSISNQMNHVRLSRTPFSHRFEHSDVTARTQAMGLQAIGSAWAHSNMGSEAALMASRYGRR